MADRNKVSDHSRISRVPKITQLTTSSYEALQSLENTEFGLVTVASYSTAAGAHDSTSEMQPIE
jgi:hypothetical protein